MKKMTNKMPVVGKRYHDKNYIVRCDEIWSDRVILNRDGSYFDVSIEGFSDYFEELPEDNLQETEEVRVNEKANPVDLENGEANKIDKALEELKEAISKSLGKITCVNDVNKLNFKLMDVRIAAQHLVNALEVSNLKPKIDIKEECVDPVNIRKETYRCAHDYILKNQGYNNSDHLIREYKCSICGENKMTIQS